MNFRNRIIGYEEVDPEQLLANPLNWRIHPQAQQEALEGVLSEVGWVDDIIVNKNTGFVIDGHLRVALAISNEEKAIPVKYVDLDEEEEKLILATIDPIAAMAATDKDMLEDILAGIETDNEQVSALIDDIAKREKLNLPVVDDPGAEMDRADELQEKWQVEREQVWQIGDHRLMCGDSTSIEDTNILLNGTQAKLGVTSPPYAVGKEYEKDTDFKEHLDMLRGVADVAGKTIEAGGFLFINFGEIAAQSHTKALTGSKRQCIYPISKDYWQIFHVERGMDLYAARIWYKPFNRLQKPFWTYKTSIPHHQEWEHLWTFRLPGDASDQVYDWNTSVRSVWDTRDEDTDDKPLTRHTAAFPTCLPRRAIKAHSQRGDIIWEPFSGSGTTIVVCEQEARKCRAMEIEPKYCAVTLERMSNVGLKPKQVGKHGKQTNTQK